MKITKTGIILWVLSGFNWTLHYQRDSTFSMPYGWKKKRPVPLQPDHRNYAENKTRSVVWVVSRCDTAKFQRREHYVAEVPVYNNQNFKCLSLSDNQEVLHAHKY